MGTQRIDYTQAAPAAFKAMLALERHVRGSGLEPSLIELVKMRASQINGCAYCLDMHYKDARAAGETEERLNMIAVWRESPLFTERERAALAWTETLTLLPQHGAPDNLYEHALREFGPKDLTNLTMAIITINGWNRLGVGFRLEPGHYQPASTTR